jgi:ribosomal protein S18 acetylase RimI-like enzyme
VAGLSFSTNDHYAEIHFTAVDEQRRRKGIGRDCVQELVLILKTPQYHVPTIVVQSDEEARGFYKRVSFTSPSYEEREALYNDGLQRFMGTLLVRKCERLADKAKKGSDFRGGKRRRMVADDEGDNDRCV